MSPRVVDVDEFALHARSLAKPRRNNQAASGDELEVSPRRPRGECLRREFRFDGFDERGSLASQRPGYTLGQLGRVGHS